MNTTGNDAIITATREWVEKAVIGLNLCPFAKAVYVKEQIRYVVSTARDVDALLNDLSIELEHLRNIDAAQTDTTLLIHPRVLHDFLDYNEFLDLADATLEALELDGQLQVASFHPDYQFADTELGDIGNYTNRSPFPTLHLLREESIERAVAAFPEADAIFETNVRTLNELGIAGWRALGLPVRAK